MPHAYTKKNIMVSIIILLTYMGAQLSGFVFMKPFHEWRIAQNPQIAPEALAASTVSLYTVISFVVALVLIMVVTTFSKGYFTIYPNEPKASIGKSIGWGLLGFVLVLIGQSLAAFIETTFFGVEVGSQNTQNLVRQAQAAPIILLVIAIVGPILEELVFRRVIFGSLIKTTNFFIAALISSVVFAAIHMDFTHLLVYAVSGFIFAFLYHKTKRLWVPMIAHISLNTFVSLVQLTNSEEILKQLEQQFIFWLHL